MVGIIEVRVELTRLKGRPELEVDLDNFVVIVAR